MTFGLERRVMDGMHSVFKKHPEIEKVVIYGSRAKGNYRSGSDIDLTLMGRGLTERLLSSIVLELDDLNMPYLLDISLFKQLQSPDLEEHIHRVGRLFYEANT